jgi:hypothetical protein
MRKMGAPAALRDADRTYVRVSDEQVTGAIISACALAARGLRRRCQVEAVHRLGPRPLAELLGELDRHFELSDFDVRLERYPALDPDLFRAVSADRLPHLPIRFVPGGRQ